MIKVVLALFVLFLNDAMGSGSLLEKKEIKLKKNVKKNEIKKVYSAHTELDFEGAQIDGEVKNPGEFYFEHKPEDNIESLVSRRKNFQKEMLRDSILNE